MNIIQNYNSDEIENKVIKDNLPKNLSFGLSDEELKEVSRNAIASTCEGGSEGKAG